MTSVRLSDISKRFGHAIALENVSLDIVAGELFFLLGPSGCGKSTLLRLVAGLLAPDRGKIYFGDRDVTSERTQARSAVMCFQSYALWPHMTVRQNVEFGLRRSHLTKAEQHERLRDSLRLVKLEQYEKRLPGELSGGQQQRVALARALAVRPKCLLLDEPLSNLDAALRLEMRGEIRRICKSVGCTTIYVTHDQKEAMAIADRLAVLRDGKLIQSGTPADCYHKPVSSFVAGFLGQTNLIGGHVVRRDGQVVQVQTALGALWATAVNGSLPQEVIVSVRPERIRIATSPLASPGGNRVAGKVVQSSFLGESTELVMAVSGQQLLVSSTPPLANVAPEAAVEFDARDALALPS